MHASGQHKSLAHLLRKPHKTKQLISSDCIFGVYCTRNQSVLRVLIRAEGTLSPGRRGWAQILCFFLNYAPLPPLPFPPPSNSIWWEFYKGLTGNFGRTSAPDFEAALAWTSSKGFEKALLVPWVGIVLFDYFFSQERFLFLIKFPDFSS